MYCPICKTKLNRESFCPNCGQAIDYSNIPDVPEVSSAPMEPTPAYTQQSPYAPTYQAVPQEIKHWNWGAFMFNIMWGIGNKSYLPLLCFIPYFNIIWMFVCGAKGNEWAWKSNNYGPEDVEKFLAIQDTWNRGGIAKFIIGIASFVMVLLVLIIFSAVFFSIINEFGY